MGRVWRDDDRKEDPMPDWFDRIEPTTNLITKGALWFATVYIAAVILVTVWGPC
jgi:hypothetical protein